MHDNNTEDNTEESANKDNDLEINSSKKSTSASNENASIEE